MRWTPQRILLGALIVAAVASTHLFARQQEEQVFRSRTDLVNITATIVDRTGRSVTNLRREDFTILEDGKPQEIAFFGSGADTPLSIGLVVDTSGSMIDKIDDVEDALAHFMTTLREQDEAFVMTFANVPDIWLEFTGPSDRLRRSVRNFVPNGGTALYDAVVDAVDYVARGRNTKKALLLLTDGNDTSSSSSRRDADRAIDRSEALVYALGIGHGSRGSFGHPVFGGGFGGFGGHDEDTVDMGVLRGLADASGGQSILLEDAHRGGVDRIDQAVTEVATELRQQYTIGYYPPAPGKKGDFHRIEIKLTNRDYKVRARRGYWTE